jgi:hypothetical protein
VTFLLSFWGRFKFYQTTQLNFKTDV